MSPDGFKSEFVPMDAFETALKTGAGSAGVFEDNAYMKGYQEKGLNQEG